jgi:hypothetical protein
VRAEEVEERMSWGRRTERARQAPMRTGGGRLPWIPAKRLEGMGFRRKRKHIFFTSSLQFLLEVLRFRFKI